MKNKPLQSCYKQSYLFLCVCLCVCVESLWSTDEYRSDILMQNQGGTLTLSLGPALCPRPICSLGPQSQSLSTELRTTAKCLNAGCTALLIIQFVEKQLPIWHIWCNSHLVCLNWTMRKEEEEEEEWLYSAGWCYIFSHLLHRFEVVIQCCLRDEIVLTAYERAHILTGDLLFLGSFRLFVFWDNLHYSLLSFIFKLSFTALETSACLAIHPAHKQCASMFRYAQ